jgi:hypothetical protein
LVTAARQSGRREFQGHFTVETNGDVHRLDVCPGLMELMDNAGALPTTPQAQQQPEWFVSLVR